MKCGKQGKCSVEWLIENVFTHVRRDLLKRLYLYSMFAPISYAFHDAACAD